MRWNSKRSEWKSLNRLCWKMRNLLQIRRKFVEISDKSMKMDTFLYTSRIKSFLMCLFLCARSVSGHPGNQLQVDYPRKSFEFWNTVKVPRSFPGEARKDLHEWVKDSNMSLEAKSHEKRETSQKRQHSNLWLNALNPPNQRSSIANSAGDVSVSFILFSSLT